MSSGGSGSGGGNSSWYVGDSLGGGSSPETSLRWYEEHPLSLRRVAGVTGVTDRPPTGYSSPGTPGTPGTPQQRSRNSTVSSGCDAPLCSVYSSLTHSSPIAHSSPISIPPSSGSLSGGVSLKRTSTSPKTGKHRPGNIVISASRLVPGVDFDFESPRLCSPPPDRRGSFASTTSDASSVTIPLSSSYQNLLSPLWTCASSRYCSDADELLTDRSERETPPERERAVSPLPSRSRSAMAQSNPGDCICVPPVVLSPVLSRPVRSQSAASSPLPFRNQNSDSESDVGALLRGVRRSTGSGSMCGGGGGGGGSSRPMTPTQSPILNRSHSGTKLAGVPGTRTGSSSSLLSGRVFLHRTDSEAAALEKRKQRRTRRRTSFLVAGKQGMCSETSVDSACSSSSSNLVRMRCSLGHSDPQISASSHSLNQSDKPIRMRKDVASSAQAARIATNSRRSLNASPILTGGRCRSPAGRQLLPSGSGVHRTEREAAAASAAPSSARATAPVGVAMRCASSRSGSSLMAPQHDNRRWSLASLPSTSGYGTPGSNSAFSSQYSSSEQLCDVVDGMRLHHPAGGGGGHAGHAQHAGLRLDSADSFTDDTMPHCRPRSRSLTSPIKLGGEFSVEVVNRNSVYKERFPKAKTQMEERLCAFVADNGPLSGGSAEQMDALAERGSRKSMVLQAETLADPAVLRLIADGATRFLHHQVVEIAGDCLARSRDDLITCSYFCEMSQRLEETLHEAQAKTSPESLVYLSKLVKQLLMIVSRPARLLECLEFDPDEFYQLLEEAEGVVREQLGSGTARVPDLPQYIIGKLGLDRDPLLEEERSSQSPSPPPASAAAPRTTGPAAAAGGSGGSQDGKAPSEEDLETIRLVSNGAYGAVFLVRHRETRQRFALKKMSKQTLMLRNQVDQVFAERDILTMADNPFVVSFYGSFETRHHLCMLMEYVEGGDCAALLKNAGTLPLDLARLYVAETVLAIEYLHSYGIVHRDLKPDNLLITAMGHIKLTDFGLSKIGLMNRTTLVCEGYDDTQQFNDKQLCGTPEYIAPEVILRQGYGKPVDWWALGVILYEFLVGCVPFFGESPDDLFCKVISEEVEYPDGDEALPPEAEHLVRRLLEKNPVERLGSGIGARELMAAPLFAGLDFNSLLRQKAEFVPQLDNEEDTSYFDTRADRYNHDVESGGEDAESAATANMFHSFSTASPRHSIVELPQLPPSALAAGACPSSGSCSSSGYQPAVQPERSLPEGRWRKPSSTQSSEDHHDSSELGSERMSGESGGGGACVSSAVLLRRRFSAARQHNLSTSSSGTTGTAATACSSTDSSMDAGHQELKSPLPRFAISCDPDETLRQSLSPVDEQRTGGGQHTDLQLTIPCGSCAGPSSPGALSQSSASSVDGGGGASPQPDASAALALLQAPILIKKGPLGFGFTIKSVRVYLGEHSEYYTIEHMVTGVDIGSPAYEAGLRADDLLTAVNGQPVHNLTHPQLMHRLLSQGNELSLKVTPLSATSIKEGAARKSVGKLAKKQKPKRPTRRVPMEKKGARKGPSSLLRRLSGKRPTNDIVPGSSSQKQTFMPRSVSSQDGAIMIPIGGAPSSSQLPAPPPVAPPPGKRLSDVGLRLEEHRSPLVSSSRPQSLHGLHGGKTAVASSPIPVSPLARDRPSPSRSPSPSGRGSTTGRSLMSRLLHKQ